MKRTHANMKLMMVVVVVFSKSYCPYCTASKNLLNELGAKYTTLELDQLRKKHFPHLTLHLSIHSSS